MKTNRNIATIALAVALIFGGALTCSAQSYNGGNQQFGLSTELASYLQLSTSQIDGISRNLLLLDYDWNEAINNTLLLDEQLMALQNDGGQSPSAIGAFAGSYIQQKVTIARAIIAEVVASNKALLAMLTVSQQQKLAAVQSAVNAQNASNIYSINSDAFFGNLFLEQYSVTGFDPNGMLTSYPTTQATGAALSQLFNNSVEQAHTKRANEQAATARAARMIPLEGKR